MRTQPMIEIQYHVATDDSQHIESPKASAQILKLKPDEFNYFSSRHSKRQWVQVPGYRIMFLVPVGKQYELSDMSDLISWFIVMKINLHPAFWKKYKIKADGEG